MIAKYIALYYVYSDKIAIVTPNISNYYLFTMIILIKHKCKNLRALILVKFVDPLYFGANWSFALKLAEFQHKMEEQEICKN